jgi:tetratricopeptide (TPR) repeat protein
MGRMDQARAAFGRGLALSENLGDRRIRSAILLALGSLHGRCGEWGQAIILGEQSLALAREDGFAEGQADALLSTGFFAFERGDWDFAISQLKRALAIASREANEVQKARILGNMAIMYNARGRSPKAIELFRESIATFDRLNLPLDVARGLNNLGFCHHSLGEYDEARTCYHQALERLGKVGDLRERGLLYLHMAETALAQQDLDVARENCVLAARRFGRLGFDLGLADVNRVYAGIARAERRLRVSERYLRAALAVYEEHGDRLNIAETHEELSRLLDECGQQGEAEEELSRSRLIFERLAEQPSEIF